MTSLVTMTNAPVFVIESNSSIKKTAGLALWMDFIEVYFHCSFSCQTELFIYCCGTYDLDKNTQGWISGWVQSVSMPVKLLYLL